MTFGVRARWIGFQRFLFAVHAHLRPSVLAPKPVQVRQVRVNGYQLLVCANEAVGQDLTRFGEFEPEETAGFIGAVRPGDVCVDVGANQGYYTLLMATRAPQGTVHAFEPIPFNYHLLRASAELNQLRNVVANCAALGPRQEERELAVSVDSGYSSFVDTGRKPVARRLRVQVTTLDGYLEHAAVPRVDIVKVDVEGAEGEVLRGATGLLGNPARRPRLIMLELFESMLQRYGTSTGAVVASLSGYGYDPFVLWHGERLPFDPERHRTFYNVWFAPRRSP